MTLVRSGVARCGPECRSKLLPAAVNLGLKSGAPVEAAWLVNIEESQPIKNRNLSRLRPG